MRFNFFLNRGGVPEGKLADVEIHFEEGPMTGLKLTGITVWKGNGSRGPYITFPSRPYMDKEQRRFYDYLRSGSKNPVAGREFKDYIIEEYSRIADDN